MEANKNGVVALIRSLDGRLLFIQRGLTLKRAPGYWCFPGGEVEPGEYFEAAIEREVREETGLQVRAGKKIRECLSPNGEYRLHWFECTLIAGLDENSDLTLHPVEVEAAVWLQPAAALRIEPLLPTLKSWLEEQIPP